MARSFPYARYGRKPEQPAWTMEERVAPPPEPPPEPEPERRWWQNPDLGRVIGAGVSSGLSGRPGGGSAMAAQIMEERRLKEDAARREANDALRAELAAEEERRREAREDRAAEAAERAERAAAARDARDAAMAEERRIDNERADKRLSMSERSAAESAARSESQLAGVESRFRENEADEDRREDARRRETERKEQLAEARMNAEKRYQGELERWKDRSGENRDAAPPNWRQIYGEALWDAGVRGAGSVPGGTTRAQQVTSPTPRTTAPAGAPKPPRETSRVPPAEVQRPRAQKPEGGAPPDVAAKAREVNFDVEAARRDGYTWAEIRKALGLDDDD
jgi:hypothetical protein